jgi:hypothetical protein
VNTIAIPPKRGRKPFDPGVCRERVAARVKKSTYTWLMEEIKKLPGTGKEQNLGRLLDKIVADRSSGSN